jgi:hypothetical protein
VRAARVGLPALVLALVLVQVWLPALVLALVLVQVWLPALDAVGQVRGARQAPDAGLRDAQVRVGLRARDAAGPVQAERLAVERGELPAGARPLAAERTAFLAWVLLPALMVPGVARLPVGLRVRACFPEQGAGLLRAARADQDASLDAPLFGARRQERKRVRKLAERQHASPLPEVWRPAPYSWRGAGPTRQGPPDVRQRQTVHGWSTPGAHAAPAPPQGACADRARRPFPVGWALR